MKILMDELAMKRSIVRMTHEIIEHNKGVQNIVLVGIKTRGEYIAKMVQENIFRFEDVKVDCVALDIAYWRDDNKAKMIERELLDIDLKDKIVVMIDDVLFKGRTVRAAMDAIIDHGRPKEIQLGVLIDRGHRELPIRADYVGKNIPTSLNESVKVAMLEVDGVQQVTLEEK